MTTLTTNPIPQDQIPDAFSVQPDAKLLGRQNISGTPTTFEFDIALVLAYVAVNLDTTTAAELTTALLGYYAKGETIADGDIPATITRDTEVAAAVSAHVAAADPHPGYLTQTEGDARYPLSATLSETIDDRVAALVLAGANITATYNDTANTFTLASTATSGGGGASGTQYTYNDADPPTASGQIRTLQASLNVASAIAISATDANGDSVTDVIARLRTGTIFAIAKDAANYVRFEATADYASGSVAVVMRAEQGTILTGDPVYLGIVSDAPAAPAGHVIQDETTDLAQRSKLAFVGPGVVVTDDPGGDRTVVTSNAVGGGFSGGTISASAGATTATITELTAPSGSTWPVYSYQWYRALATGFDSSAGNLVSGATASTLSLAGLSSGTQYFVRRVVTDAAGAKAATPEINFTTTGANPSVVALINAFTAQGYTPSTPEQTAIDNFFTAIGAQNAANTATLQSYFARFRGFLGSTFNTCRIDWIDPSATAKYLTAIGTVTYSATGMTIGTSGSGLLEDYQIPVALQDSFSFGCYLSSVPVANTRYMGASMNTTTTKTEILAGNSPNFSLTINGAFSLSAAVGAYSKGLIAIARTASNSCYARVNATTFNSVSSSQADLTFYDTANSKMLIGGSRRSDGTVFSAAGTKIGCSCILNTGIPVADMISIENAINALMVALGRN